MAHNKTHEEIEEEFKNAKKFVKVGGTYSHYKHPENLYTVIAIATQEATDKICVIYQANYGKEILFVRDLDSWIEKPLLNGKRIKRFKLVK